MQIQFCLKNSVLYKVCVHSHARLFVLMHVELMKTQDKYEEKRHCCVVFFSCDSPLEILIDNTFGKFNDSEIAFL